MIIFKRSVKTVSDVAYFTLNPRILFVYAFSDIMYTLNIKLYY